MNSIVLLPAGLSPAAGNFLAALVQRQTKSDASAAVYLSKNYAFNGSPPDSYLWVASLNRFAWAGSLTAAFLAAAAETAVGNTLPVLPPEAPTAVPFPLVAGCNIQLTGVDLILDEVTDFDSLAGTLLVFIDGEIMSISTATLTGSGAYSLTVVRGFFGTAIQDHVKGASVFIVRRNDVIPFTHPSFQTGNVIGLKIPIAGQNLSDAAPLGYAVGTGTPLIPAMTYDNAPSGLVLYVDELSNYPAWAAFDGITDANFLANSGTWAGGPPPDYVGYQFTTSSPLATAWSFTIPAYGETAPDIILQGSNDGSSWTTLDAYNPGSGYVSGTTIRRSFSNAVPYSYYKFIYQSGTQSPASFFWPSNLRGALIPVEYELIG